MSLITSLIIAFIIVILIAGVLIAIKKEEKQNIDKLFL